MEEFGSCVEHATDAYLRRKNLDVNPSIVQFLTEDGKPDSHWYYRSRNIISTSRFDWTTKDVFGPYEGPVEDIPQEFRRYFEEGRFKPFPFLVDYIKKSYK